MCPTIPQKLTRGAELQMSSALQLDASLSFTLQHLLVDVMLSIVLLPNKGGTDVLLQQGNVSFLNFTM